MSQLEYVFDIELSYHSASLLELCLSVFEPFVILLTEHGHSVERWLHNADSWGQIPSWPLFCECALGPRCHFVDLFFLLRSLRDKGIFFKADISCPLMEILNQKEQLLVQESCVLSLRKKTLSAAIWAMRSLAGCRIRLVPILAHFAIDRNQVLELSSKVLR